jgi:hypothetical protein
MIRLRYGGNGHTRGSNAGSDGSPGTVKVFWKGAPEQEIVDISEFTPNNTLHTQGFADDSFSYPANPSIKSPTQGLIDKGNWMELRLPDMAPGRHMMVWAWFYVDGTKTERVQWTTCFDVIIQGPHSIIRALPAPTPSSVLFPSTSLIRAPLQATPTSLVSTSKHYLTSKPKATVSQKIPSPPSARPTPLVITSDHYLAQESDIHNCPKQAFSAA